MLWQSKPHSGTCNIIVCLFDDLKLIAKKLVCKEEIEQIQKTIYRGKKY